MGCAAAAMLSRSWSRLVISLTTACIRWPAKMALMAACSFLKPFSTNSFSLTDGSMAGAACAFAACRPRPPLPRPPPPGACWGVPCDFIATRPRLALAAASRALRIASPSIVWKLYSIMIWSIQPHSAAAVTISGSWPSWQLRPQKRILPDLLEPLERRLDRRIAEERDLGARRGRGGSSSRRSRSGAVPGCALSRCFVGAGVPLVPAVLGDEVDVLPHLRPLEDLTQGLLATPALVALRGVDVPHPRGQRPPGRSWAGPPSSSPSPGAGTFWPVLPRVTIGSSLVSAHADVAGASAAVPPATAAVLRKSRRLPPPIPSF